jgi:hypothetical protein
VRETPQFYVYLCGGRVRKKKKHATSSRAGAAWTIPKQITQMAIWIEF